MNRMEHLLILFLILTFIFILTWDIRQKNINKLYEGMSNDDYDIQRYKNEEDITNLDNSINEIKQQLTNLSNKSNKNKTSINNNKKIINDLEKK